MPKLKNLVDGHEKSPLPAQVDRKSAAAHDVEPEIAKEAPAPKFKDAEVKDQSLFGKVDGVVNVLELDLSDIQKKIDSTIDAITKKKDELEDLHTRLAQTREALGTAKKFAGAPEPAAKKLS